MSLIEDVQTTCKRLSPHGWGELLAEHGLDLEADDFEAELTRPLEPNRNLPGFEDFAVEGFRAIEPGQPARSVLYHALASPSVTHTARGEALEAMPTLAEIKRVEDLVFGLRPPTLDDLRARFPGVPLALGIFAYEYRPGAATAHRRHADLCFSRTGVARVGTRPARYDAAHRSFTVDADNEEPLLRALPAQYAAWIAVQLPGEHNAVTVLNASLRELAGHADAPDADRLFWVPIHKLFPGPECVRDRDLELTLTARHRNEKLRRIHLRLGRASTGWGKPDIDNPPFVVEDGIAELDPELGPGVLVPTVHDRLVEPARRDGRLVGFTLSPEHIDGAFAPSLWLRPTDDDLRPAPEFVHVRHVLDDHGDVQDLNERPDVAQRVAAGGYRALHYVDFTGDGSVSGSCPQLALDLPLSLSAYSLVTAPDFYPGCSQRELLEWWLERVPEAIRNDVWAVPPLTLADTRLPPNLQLPGTEFAGTDNTVTAVVSLGGPAGVQRPMPPQPEGRHAHLPDAAAGVFAPGWDTSLDATDGIQHLASYGLGSPFPEDAKLCAALSAFWPSASPDTGRSFSQVERTVSPLSDAELGINGGPAWDGWPGPRPLGAGQYRYASFQHVDYVQTALDDSFTLAQTSEVTTERYAARVLAMRRVYAALGVNFRPRRPMAWNLLSFRELEEEEEQELAEAEAATGERLTGHRFRMLMGKPVEFLPDRQDHRQVLVRVTEETTLLVGDLPLVLMRPPAGRWMAQPVD